MDIAINDNCQKPHEARERPIHLVIVIDTLAGGGAEKTMLRLASTFISLGHQVEFIVINPIVSHEIPDNITIEFVYKTKIKRGIRYFFYRNTAKLLQHILDELNIKTPINAVFSVLAETDRITQYIEKYPVLHCIRSNLYQGTVKNRKTAFSRWIKQKRIQHVYNNKHMLFISKGAQQELLEDIGVKPASSSVIYNPYPIIELQHLAREHDVEFRDYFIHVGRYSYPKRQDKLLQIYAESGLKNPLLLMGEGSLNETEKLHSLIHQYELEDRVFMIEFKKNPFPYIYNSNALLLTSDHESLSNVIIESLICGTPVIAYDCPSGPREILEGNLKQFLIPFNNTHAFIDKLKELSQNKIRVCPEIANIDRFEANAIAKQYMAAITNIKK